MDGVLVDFNEGYFKLTGHKLDGTYRTDERFWDPINEAGYDFWINLKWMSDGRKLWSHIEKFNPELLSAPSRQPDSRIAKHDWVKRELPGVHFILRSAKNKKEFASPTSILIDDREDNINDWIGAGGIGILHKNAKDTIGQLHDLGL